MHNTSQGYFLRNLQARDDDNFRRRTLYVTGFNPELTTKPLLKELFTQGGPVTDITLFETHAYILFQHEESVPYCLALFNELELHGVKLRLNPRFRNKDTYCYMNYLSKVRAKLRDQNMMIPAPDLPPKKYTATKDSGGKGAHRSPRKAFRSHGAKNDSSTKKTKRGKRNKAKTKSRPKKFETR